MNRLKAKVTTESLNILAPGRVLLAQNQSEDPSGLHNALKRAGFEVVVISSVADALKALTADPFSALICDLHLPAACDGFTLINAVRHIHPDAITMVISDYPRLRESVADILPQADEVLVSPIPPQEIVKLLKSRLLVPRHRAARIPQPVATVLEANALTTIKEWLKRVKQNKALTRIVLSDGARTGHLPALLRELVARLRTPHLEEGKARISDAAIAHGRVRKDQGYTAAMLVQESRLLQVSIFKILRNNLSAVDLALVLTDVMTIADEVDSQLTQTIQGFSESAAPAKNLQLFDRAQA